MKYCFDEMFDRRVTGAEKWYGISDENISMTIADMDFPLMPEVGQAIKETVNKREFGYLEMKEENYNVILSWIQRRTGERVPREYLIDTPGVLYTMRTAMYALTEPGDKVIVQTPLHTPSIATASMNGRIPLKNRLIYQDGDYMMDYDNLEQCFRDGGRVLMMCAPNNPTGRVWSKEELDKVAELVNKYDAYLLVDEIHRDIIWEGNKHISPSSMPNLAERTVAAFSTSKTFNMGGFHIGSAIIPSKEIRDKVIKQFYSFGYSCGRPTVIDMAAQTAVYSKGEEWYKQMLTYVEGNIDLALEYLEGLPLHASKPQGTFLLWADISDLRADRDKLCNIMQDQWKVLCDPGSYYDTKDYREYKGMEHHIRFNLATQRMHVEQAFDRIRKSFMLR